MKKIIHFRTPLDEHGKSIYRFAQIQEMVSVLRDAIGEGYTVLASPFGLETNVSDDIESVMLSDIDLSEFLTNNLKIV